MGTESEFQHLKVPLVVTYLFLAYRSHDEYFDWVGNDILISDDRTTMTSSFEKCWECGDMEFEDCYECRHALGYKKPKMDPCALGKQVIPSHLSYVATWKLRINALTDNERRY